MFQVNRITQAVWPEMLGVGTFLGAQLMAAAADVARAKKAEQEGKEIPYPWAQSLVTWGGMGTGLVAIGYNRATQFATGLVYGSGVMVAGNAMRQLYEAATKEPEATKAASPRMFALVATPRALGVGKPGMTIIAARDRIPTPQQEMVEAGRGSL